MDIFSNWLERSLGSGRQQPPPFRPFPIDDYDIPAPTDEREREHVREPVEPPVQPPRFSREPDDEAPDPVKSMRQPDVEPEPARVDVHTETLARIERTLADLSSTVASRLRYDKDKEQAFEVLYSELDGLKKKAVFEQIRPLLFDLVLLFDRVDNLVREPATSPSLKGRDANSPGASYVDDRTLRETPLLAQTLGTIRDELLEVLARQGVEVIETHASAFDPSLQQAIGVEPTRFPDQDNRVASTARRGFTHLGRVLRAEQVIVRKYK